MTIESPCSAIAVANHFIDLAHRDGVPLTPMKLQKLVFFAHGWHLAITGEPLVAEHVEVWSYGPVIPSIYHEFKSFGSKPITRKGTDILANEGGIREIEFGEPKLPDDGDLRRLLVKIWDVYGGFSATRLSNMTHVADGPWARGLAEMGNNFRRNTDLNDDYIREYFIELAQNQEA